MEFTHNLKQYLKYYEISENEGIEQNEQDNAITKMEELYYELTPEEIAYLEEKQIV